MESLLAPQWPLVLLHDLDSIIVFFAHRPNRIVGFGPKSSGTDGKPTAKRRVSDRTVNWIDQESCMMALA